MMELPIAKATPAGQMMARQNKLRGSSTGTLAALNLESVGPSKHHPSITGKKKKNEPLSAFMQHAAMTSPNLSKKQDKIVADPTKGRQEQRRRSSGQSTFSEQELQEMREKLDARAKHEDAKHVSL